MTVRLSVSLPDDVHADLLRLAGASNISAGAVVRAILSDVLPKMTSILDYVGTLTPETAGPAVAELDAWAAGMRNLLHDAPESLDAFRAVFDEKPEGDDKP